MERFPEPLLPRAMAGKEKLERVNLCLSRYLEYIAIGGLLLMMSVTTVDVVGAKLFRWRVFGAIDMVMLAQIVAIALSGGATLIAGRHIAVEFFVRKLPKGTRKLIDFLVSLMLLGFVLIAMGRLIYLGHSFQQSGEHSATAYIPLFPFAYVIALGFVPFILWGLVKILEGFEGGDK